MVARCLIAMLLLAPASLAQEEGPTPTSSSPSLDAKPRAWRLQATPGVWYVGLGGDLTMPGGSGSGSPATLDLADLELDGPRLAPALRVDARLDPWRLTLSGFSTSAEGRWSVASPLTFGTLAVGSGDRVDSQVDYTGLEFGVGYRLWETRRGVSPASRVKVQPSVTAFAGARLHEVGARHTLTSGSATTTQDADETFAEPIAGLRLELDLYERATVDVQVDGGYSGPSASWSIWVGFQYRPLDWLGLYAGYRHLGFDLERGSGTDRFHWQGAAAGVGAGAVIRF